MFRAGSPSRGATAARLGVSGAWRRAFAAASDSARDPALRAYLADMLRPYGLALAQDRLTEGQSYAEMAGALLAQEVAAESPVDLLVFAFAVPDVAPWRATASYLSSLCPGQPFAFAVCDQGVTAPFTALRLIREYASTGGCRRALLVVAEQAAMPYRQPGPAATPARHAVVALLWDQSASSGHFGHFGSGSLERVCLHASVTRPQACRLLAEAVADLPAADDLTTVVGTGLAGDVLAAGLPGRVVIAPPEQPSTGVWWQVAAGLPEWAGQGLRDLPDGQDAPNASVLLADYDPGPGHLGLAVIEIPGGRR